MVEIAVKLEEVEVGGSAKYHWTYRQGKEKVEHFGEDVTMYLEHDGMIYLAVADGVGSWRFKGIDALILTQALMKQLSKLCKGRTANKTSCYDLIQKAFALLKEMHLRHEGIYRGTCTFCFARIDKKTGMMEVANIGDSQLAVNRKNHRSRFIFCTRTRYLRGETPAQIGVIPKPRFTSDISTDLFADCRNETDVYHFQLKNKDQIIIASDGIWQNLSKIEINKVLSCSPSLVKHSKTRELYTMAKEDDRFKIDDISIIHGVVTGIKTRKSSRF